MAEETPPEAEAAEPGKKSGLAAMVPLIGGIVGGLALGATLGFTMLGPRLAHKSQPAPVVAAAPASNSIDDDEFEALLDQLHGSGAPASAGGAIDDDEFEALLDNLHGKGGTPGQASASAPTAAA